MEIIIYSMVPAWKLNYKLTSINRTGIPSRGKGSSTLNTDNTINQAYSALYRLIYLITDRLSESKYYTYLSITSYFELI